MARFNASSDIGKHMEPPENLCVSGNNSSRYSKRRNMAKERKCIDDDDLDGDETFTERLMGLTEMFPDSVRNSCCTVSKSLKSLTKNGCWFLRNALWIISSSAVILALPVVFESERAQQHQEALNQQRQILLGPNAAVSGSQGSNNLLPGMGMMPPPPK